MSYTVGGRLWMRHRRQKPDKQGAPFSQRGYPARQYAIASVRPPKSALAAVGAIAMLNASCVARCLFADESLSTGGGRGSAEGRGAHEKTGASSLRRVTPTCCSSLGPSRPICSSLSSAPTTPRQSRNGSSPSATVRWMAVSSPAAPQWWAGHLSGAGRFASPRLSPVTTTAAGRPSRAARGQQRRQIVGFGVASACRTRAYNSYPLLT
jgi:hypothetical protein